MAGVRARIDGVKQLRARLAAVGSNKQALGIIAREGVGEAKRLYVAQSRQTGNLGRTIRVGSISDTSATVVAGGTAQVGYAVYVERGTRPHVIRAKPGGVLAWPATAAGRRKSGSANARALKGSPGLGKAGGGLGGLTIQRVGKVGKTSGTFRYARRVNHPGSRAKPYLVPGVRAALKKAGLRKAIVNAWDRAA